MSREEAAVLARVEDELEMCPETGSITVHYPWNPHAFTMRDNSSQAISRQLAVEKRVLALGRHQDYVAEMAKAIDSGPEGTLFLSGDNKFLKAQGAAQTLTTLEVIFGASIHLIDGNNGGDLTIVNLNISDGALTINNTSRNTDLHVTYISVNQERFVEINVHYKS